MIQKLSNLQNSIYSTHKISFKGITSNPLPEQDSDRLELSSTQNKKDNRTKLAMICAAVLGVAAICFAIYKHKNLTKSIESVADA